MSTHLLLVEDDHDLRDALESTLKRAKWDVTAVDSAEAGLAALQLRSADLVVSDIRLPGMDGLALLQRLREQSSHTPVVLMTAHADAMLAIAALKAGARDLLLKPFGAEQLVDVVRRHAPQVRSEAAASGLLASDPLMRTLVARAERAARVDASVLLTGESGVGKEVMARHIHLASARARAPFIAINCAAIPDSLLEATLFGHEKGSFTGASRQQAGKFEQAQGGTLFLDEIGELPIETQVKLLRVLQERSLERLGGQSSIAVDIRIIAATNRDLARDVASGRFREDLYYRLAVFPVLLPPLRDRPGDIVPLAHSFVQRYGRSFGMADAQLSPAAEAALLRHRWPGNVRELENTIQRGLLLTDSGLIEARHLELPEACAAIEAPEPLPAPVVVVHPVLSTAAEPQRPRNVRDVEREHILGVLEQVQGNRRAAIAILGISERALRYKLKAYRELDGTPVCADSMQSEHLSTNP
jgi:two-component system response regulator FlrC